MAENVSEKKALVNPFCPQPAPFNGVKLDKTKYKKVVSGSVNKETLQFEPVYDEYDLKEEIQASRNLCGLEYMKQLLKSGRISAEELADNSGGNYDLTGIPESVHEAKAEADKLNEELSKVAKAAGLEEGHSYTSDQFEEAVKKATASALADIQAKQAAAKTEEK